ncbi:hypothetical protein BDV59DRAFT_96572 [Aspergillus ambiguus]|uniref:uncharacterized protein n=1 Tax=Aspergillus ambiguus TaxID=176160 RepID=UPI003CCD6C30
MSYYEPQGWQAPASRQVSWEQPIPPSRSGSSSVSQRDEVPAFSSQFDEVDRAIDNLVKSGKLWTAPRRDSMPMMMGRPYPEFDPRVAGAMSQRHHSISEFDGSRMHPNPNLQGFYAAQRFQGRPNEVEQMMQAKRRMAAQRERELRNYHQEQQYNRSLLAEMSGNKSDRSLSPAAMSEESRRDLLARQHRALYGNESPAFFPPTAFGDDAPHPESQTGGTPTSAAGVRGASPRGMDPFGLSQTPVQGSGPDGVPPGASLQSPSRANSTSSPSSGVNPVFGDQSVTSASSPGGAESPSSRQGSSKPPAGPIGSVGPIGSRPVQQAGPVQATKRSTTPLPSPLGFGFTPGDSAAAAAADRSVSAASNPPTSAAASAPGVKDPSAGVGLGWGNGSGVWGSKNGLGVQASVWG